MRRYRPTGPRDEPGLEDGDNGFTGVNELAHPSALRPGEVAACRNGRFTFAKAEPRLGVAKLPWTNRVASGVDTPLPFGDIHGGDVFQDAAGLEWLIIAADGRVYKTREGQGASDVALPPGVTLTGTVTFTQTTQGLVLWRGYGLDPLLMVSLDTGFAPAAVEANEISGAETENPSDGTRPIPPSEGGEWIGNRLFVPTRTETEKDLLDISDYLNATAFAVVRPQARINQGSNDALVRFFKFNENQGIAFKSQSVYLLDNVLFDLSEMRLQELVRGYGLAGRDAVAAVGRDVWFLAEKRGICSITQTAEGKLQAVDVPVSAELQQTIERIDWRYASGAQFAYWDNKMYAAVPLDDSKAYGRELIRDLTYSGGGSPAFVNLRPGASYLWTKGANDEQLVNGAETLSDTGEFVAAGTQVELHGTEPGLPVTASLKRCYVGTNNAVLVYDFLRGKWAGHDAGSAIMVKRFVRTGYNGLQRLFFLSADGFINLVEELFYDEAAYESFGPNLISEASYVGVGIVMAEAEEGRAYAVELSGDDLSLTNGTEVVTAPYAGMVVAQGAWLTLRGVPAGTVSAKVHLVSWTLETEWIDHDWTSRGYTAPGGGQSRKRWTEGALHLEHWFAEYSVFAQVEGLKEEVTLVDGRTFDGAAYFKPFGAEAWDRTNADDDHAEENREEYAVTLGETTTASGSIQAGLVYFVESADVTTACSIRYNGVDYTNQQLLTGVAGVTTYTVLTGTPRVYGPGNYLFLGAAGVNFDQHQEYTEQLRLRATLRGRMVQLRVRSARGRVAVLGLSVRGQNIDRREGVFS